MGLYLASTKLGQQSHSVWGPMSESVGPLMLKWLVAPIVGGTILVCVVCLAATAGMFAGALSCRLVGIQLSDDDTPEKAVNTILMLFAIAGVGCFIWFAGPVTWHIVLAWWNA